MSIPERTLWLRLGSIVALLLVISGCSIFGDAPRATSTTGVGRATPGDQGSPGSGGNMPGDPGGQGQTIPSSPDQIVEGGLVEPRTLNPVLVADPISEELSHLIFNGLVHVDPVTGAPTPDLAASWEVSEDRLTYTFHLRDGVVWHDGQPFSARDVVFTYQLMMNDKARSPRYSRLVERVQNVASADQSTVTFELIRPDASFLTTLATFGIVPEHLLRSVLPEELVTNPFGISSAIGTGPFIFQQWLRGDRIVLRRNDRYFEGAPKTAQYIYQVVSQPGDLLAGLQSGSIDWCRLDPALAAQAAELEGVRVESLPSYRMIYVALQLDPTKSTLFLDPRVRQALMLALDRLQAGADIWQGRARVANGILPPASWAYTESGTVYQQNIDEARRLLEEAGWFTGDDGIRSKDGQRLRFTLATNGANPQHRRAVEWLRASWQAIGVEVIPQYEKWSSVRQRAVRTREFEALLLEFRSDLDPDLTPIVSSDSFFDSLNIGHYSNAEVDALLEQALATENPDERRQLYAQAQDLVLRDLPLLPLSFPEMTVVFSQHLHDVKPTAILVRNRANIEQWVPANRD